MSSSLINHNPDLRTLHKSGYSLEIRGAYLVVKDIPYLRTPDGELGTADLVTSLELDGQTATPPSDHTIWWTGEAPYRADGQSMEAYLSCAKWEAGHDIGEGLTVYMQWSRKPVVASQMRAYTNYEEKITTYVQEVGGEAESKHPGVLEAAKAGHDPIIEVSSRFKYLNTSTYRYGLKGIERRIEDEVVAIIGVGGSGSYLVDILAKTNIKELHLFDDDVMEQHSAFRVAGAARIEELGGTITKADWHRGRYAAVREQGVYVNKKKVDGSSADYLSEFTTVFIAVDDLEVRRAIQRKCNELGVYHVSVGIGVEIEGESNDQLGGMVKVETRFHPRRPRLEDSDSGGGVNQIYGKVQTAELNMLSAALAIIEWKAKVGIYRNERTEDADSVLFSSTTGQVLRAHKGESSP